MYFTLASVLTLLSCHNDGDSNITTAEGTTGKGGSTARFTVVGDYLYTVDEYDINTFEISNAGQPILKNNNYIGWDIETIFPRGKDKLFIGSTRGMYIYDISNPEVPQYLSVFRHVVSCDPVVADANYAYVTLRSTDNWCGNNVNQLDILDVRNLSDPKLIKTYDMHGPYGLGIQRDNLFVCDNGLKVYDVNDKKSIRLIKHFSQVQAQDVIPNGKYLIMTSEDGIYQYKLDGKTIKQVSVL